MCTMPVTFLPECMLAEKPQPTYYSIRTCGSPISNQPANMEYSVAYPYGAYRYEPGSLPVTNFWKQAVDI